MARKNRYEAEWLLMTEAFQRAQWRVGNELARPEPAQERSRREIEAALRGEAGLTDEVREEVATLVEEIEENLAVLITLLSPAAGRR